MAVCVSELVSDGSRAYVTSYLAYAGGSAVLYGTATLLPGTDVSVPGSVKAGLAAPARPARPRTIAVATVASAKNRSTANRGLPDAKLMCTVLPSSQIEPQAAF